MNNTAQSPFSPHKLVQISFLFGMMGWGTLLLLGLVMKFEGKLSQLFEFSALFLVLLVPIFSLWGIGFGISALFKQVQENKNCPERKGSLFHCCLGILISLLSPLAEYGWILSHTGCKTSSLSQLESSAIYE